MERWAFNNAPPEVQAAIAVITIGFFFVIAAAWVAAIIIEWIRKRKR